MGAVSSPNPAALYQKHRLAMFRVAASVLRDQGLEHMAEDVVSKVMLELIEKPPQGVLIWEAWLVRASKNRALDMLKSHSVSRVGELTDRHDSPEVERGDGIDQMEWFEKVARVKPLISKMEERTQYVALHYLIRDRPRAEVAEELGVTPGRISQIAAAITTEIAEILKEGG